MFVLWTVDQLRYILDKGSNWSLHFQSNDKNLDQVSDVYDVYAYVSWTRTRLSRTRTRHMLDSLQVWYLRPAVVSIAEAKRSPHKRRISIKGKI